MNNTQRMKSDIATMDRRESEDKAVMESRNKNDVLTMERRSEADKKVDDSRSRNDELTFNRRESSDSNPNTVFTIVLASLIVLAVGALLLIV